MIILKFSFLLLKYAVLAVLIVAAACIIGASICLAVVLLQYVCRSVWYAVFPKKLKVNFRGELTEEDEEDLAFYYKNSYKGKIYINEDGIEWGGIRP